MPELPAFLRTRPAKIALGVATAGTLGYFLLRHEGKSPDSRRRRPNCSKIGTSEGELDGVRYVEHVTKGADPNAELPMLIVFHSLWANPKGSAPFNMLPPTRIIRPYGPFQKNASYSWFSERAAGNQEELTASMKETAKLMVPFVRDIAQCRPTVGEPVVTGSSQGGLMSYLLASTAQPFVRGAVAVAGWLPEPLWNENMAPTVGIHGKNDTTVPYARTKQYAEAMGFPFYGYDAGHGVNSAMQKRWVGEVKRLLGFSVQA